MSWQDELIYNNQQDIFESAKNVIGKYDLVNKSDAVCQQLLLDQIKILEEMVAILKGENAQLKQDLINAAMGIFRTASFE